MRIAFFILLLANLVLVLWQTQIQPGRDGELKLPEIPPEQRLVLVSERNPTAKTAESETAGKPKTEKSQLPSDSDLPELELLGPESGPGEEAAKTAEEPKEPAVVCFTMGPFKETGLVKMVSGRLRDIGATVSQRSKVEQEQYGYRVYLKPYATREEAAAEARRLAENGVRDYYIIADDPDKKNGISLGLFRKKSGAIRRMAQVRRFDFKPQMEIRYRDTTIYWLDFEHSPDVDSEALWRELAEETPELQRLHRDCKTD